MSVRLLTSKEELQQYSEWVQDHPQGTLWQSCEWMRYVQASGKEARIYALFESGQIAASAMVVIDRTSFGLSTWEIPGGPLQLRAMSDELREDSQQKLLESAIRDATNDRCIAFYLSPPEPLEAGSWKLEASRRYIRPEATRIIDLTQSEEGILAQMKEKGRYNIKVAQKRGVTIKQSDAIDAFYDLIKETGTRDNFTVHTKTHYEMFLKHLPGSFLLLAYEQEQTRVMGDGLRGEADKDQSSKPVTHNSQPITHNPKPIAGLLGVIWNNQGIYYYGASSYAHRASMAPYLLQWEAMRLCKARGCRSYDLLGVAPPEKATSCQLPVASDTQHVILNPQLTTHNSQLIRPHPWQGITSFKEKFGGKLIVYAPEQMVVMRPWIKRVVDLKRVLIG